MSFTTNVDHCFQKAGFDKHRLFHTQGDYGLFQCSEPCCAETFDNGEIIQNMVTAQGYTIAPDGTLTVPKLPKWPCRTADPLSGAGCGVQHPSIIKYPFWRMTDGNPRAVYACLNAGDACAPDAIKTAPSASTATSRTFWRRSKKNAEDILRVFYCTYYSASK